MPVAKELVSNKSLSGIELSKIILADVARMLDGNGLLSGHMAFGRIAYDLTLTLHLDLPQLPESSDTVRSRPTPEHPTLEPEPPLADPSPAAVVDASTLTRTIDSPNLARIEHQLPIEVTVMGQDGHQREELIEYAPTDVGLKREDFPEPEINDVTAQQIERLRAARK